MLSVNCGDIGLAIEYIDSMKALDDIDRLLAKLKAAGKTELRVRRASQAVDISATGLQNAALQQMTRTTTLSSFELVKPCEKRVDSRFHQQPATWHQ